MKRLIVLICLLPLAARLQPSLAAADASALPVKVFILAGQSNMEGQAVVDLEGPDYNEGRGTLATLLRDPVRGAAMAHLRGTDGKWTVRDDVWVRYQREQQPLLKGPLSIGYAVYGGSHHFGPELEFGHVVGDALENPVVLIKTAWGGRSLCTDFRPPSSGGKLGPYYTKMIAEVTEGLSRLPEEFPALANRAHELAGFVWYHGWNDGCESKTSVAEYEQNLVNLIKDVRRDLKAPALPVVIGELTGPWVEAPEEFDAIRKAQAAAAVRPELAGRVVFVGTRDFVREAEQSPNPGHGHHEFGHAETYVLVGGALGRGMVEVIDGGPAGYQTRTIEGWNIHLSDELLARQRAAVDAALPLLRQQLVEIVRVVPAPAVALLRKVPLWFSPEYSLVPGRAEYHPGAEWLRENGRNPAMVKGVEFTDARNFAAETSRMPNFVLHELAHAYHDRELSFDQPDIIAAYDRAMAEKLYERVRRRHGSGKPETVEPAYAVTNHKEYFAELTEALFSTNDFFPFTREELAGHDPKGMAVLRRVWGIAE
jgi:hypothetical protein